MSPPNSMKQTNAKEYAQQPSVRAEADKLIEAHISYSHAIAAEVIRKLPPDLERKDIQGWAELGLVEAANSFDRTRGVQFKTFAYYRIKGAIYDGLRKMGWYSKGVYQQMRFEMHANEYLQDVSGEAPRVGSAAGQLQDLKDMTSNLVSCYMLSLETMPRSRRTTASALRKKRSFAHNRAIIFDRPWPSCQKPTAGSWNIVILKVLRWKRRGASSGCPSPGFAACTRSRWKCCANS